MNNNPFDTFGIEHLGTTIAFIAKTPLFTRVQKLQLRNTKTESKHSKKKNF